MKKSLTLLSLFVLFFSLNTFAANLSCNINGVEKLSPIGSYGSASLDLVRDLGDNQINVYYDARNEENDRMSISASGSGVSVSTSGNQTANLGVHFARRGSSYTVKCEIVD